MIDRRVLALALLAVLPVACSGSQQGGTAQSTSDTVTRAVYSDDVGGVTSHFDDTLRPQVSRAEVGMLSDKMHALGTYKGLTFVSADPTKNEYIYRADFDKGSMNIVVRVDGDGRLAAYRLFPNVAAR